MTVKFSQRTKNDSDDGEHQQMSYSVGQSWFALKKAWRAYKIAKVQGDTANMLKYAERIRTLQTELGLPKANFPEIGLN